MKKHRNTYLIVLGLLVLALGTPAMAQYSKIETGDEDGESNECTCEGEEPCCPLGLPNGDFKCGASTFYGCNRPDGNGNIDLQICLEDLLGEGIPGYDVIKIPDGILIRNDDETPVECIGFAEESEGIGTIYLRHTSPGMVAKIHKLEDPAGPPPLAPPTAVYIQINFDNFTIPTTGPMTDDDLNGLIESTIAATYNILSYETYWIVTSRKQTGEYISQISVRADDTGLVAMNVELRPATIPPAYDEPCGF